MRHWLFSLPALLLIIAFHAQGQTLVPKNIGAVTPLDWGDYDNDGDQDLLQFNGTSLRILKNNLVGTTATFVDAGINLIDFNPTSIGWVDFNSDGFLDIYYTESGSLKLFVSQSGQSFVQKVVNLSGATLTAVADWGDIDNDGDLDVLGYGAVFKNMGNYRIEVSQSLGSSSRSEFLDFENDGDLDFYSRDLLYTNKGNGIFELDKSLSPYGTSTAYTYRELVLYGNDENGSKTFADYYELAANSSTHIYIWRFIECGDGQQSHYDVQNLAMVDFDNDGVKDILMLRGSAVELYQSGQSCLSLASLAVPSGRTRVADFDNDGDLDVFIGNNVFENKTITTNAAPATPGSPTATVSSSSVAFTWAASTDDKTPAASLTYNLLIKRGPDVVVTKRIGASGKQMTPGDGNVQYATSWIINDLPKGKYSWSVQAVDAAFKVSAPTAEKTFDIETGPDLVLAAPLPATYTTTYNEFTDRYLLTYLKSATELMGYFVDGKTSQPVGSAFKINTTTGTTIKKFVVGTNPAQGQFVVSWSEELGTSKKIYAKGVLTSGPNLHAETAIFSVADTSKVFLAGDKIVVDPASGKYFITWMKDRPDLLQPKTRMGSGETYYPRGILDVYGQKFSLTGTTITFETPKVLQSRAVPYEFATPMTRNYGVLASADLDLKRKFYTVGWSFFGERLATYGSNSSGEITPILRPDEISLIVSDVNLAVKGISPLTAQSESPRDLNLIYNSLSDQFMFVWSSWVEGTNGTGSNDYSFEVYQRIFSLQDDGAPMFKNDVTIVSKPPDITNYGSGLPSLAWSKKRNEYLIVWNKGTAGQNLGVLGEGDIFWRRVTPVNGAFIDADSRFLSSLIGNESAVSYNDKDGHFLLGWKTGAQRYLSAFRIPKDEPPVVIAISPNKAAVNDKVIITGNRLGNVPSVSKVMFGTIEAVVDPIFPVLGDPNKIRVTVPPGLTRDKVPVTIIYDDQVSNATVLFENVTLTGVTLVTPLTGEVGDVITITGTNFPADKANFQVLFGGTIAPVEDVISNTTTEIKIKVPVAAVRGDQKISVRIQDIDNIYNPYFRVIRNSLIHSVAPVEGADLISCRQMNIDGVNFSSNSADLTVKIGNFTLPSEYITSANETRVGVLIPKGISGDQFVFVKTPDGEVSSSETYHFHLGAETKSMKSAPEIIFSNQEDRTPVELEVFNACSVKEIKFWSKGISEPESKWTSEIKTSLLNGNRLNFDILEAEFAKDPIGLEGYYEVTDTLATVNSPSFRIFRNFVGSEMTDSIPELNFGGDVSDYDIVAIPYILSPNKINTVFKSILDNYGYDKSKWRISHYFNEGSNPGYKEYLSGLDNIEPGKGYWLIIRNQQEVFFDMGKTATTTKANVMGPFEITLYPGWNQIGNPYDFNISWNDILEENSTPDEDLAELESFRTFQSGSFVSTATINRFRGGFIYNNGATVTLRIPFTQNESINGGRVAQDKKLPGDLEGKQWQVALDVSAGELKNRISAFGMHPESVEDVDQRDEHRLPAFAQNLDLAFAHGLSASVVNRTDHFTWSFEVFNTTESEGVTLSWDNTNFGDNDRQLFLHDRVAERLIDMRKESSYKFTFKEGYQFNILYGDENYIKEQSLPQRVMLSEAYPNPMRNVTTIPFTVTQDRTHVQLSIYDMKGQEIRTLVNEELKAGYYALDWDGKNNNGDSNASGVVVYRLQTSAKGGVQSHVKKLVIAP